jgi:hypothetical protein
VEKLIDPATLARYRANAAALNNQAVFEIPGFLAEIFRRSDAARGASISNAAD